MAATPDLSAKDRELVLRFQSGDESAFDRLVEVHRRETYRLAYRLLGNHADADDLAQDAFLRAYRSLKRFRGDSSFRTWLTRIVLNLATDRRRERAFRRMVPLEQAPAGGAETGPNGLPAACPGGEILEKAVRQLPPRQRETLILRIFQEMRFQEIAKVMGCTVGTAKANFFHALKGLRARVHGREAGMVRERGRDEVS